MIYHINYKVIQWTLPWKHEHGPRMALKDIPVWHSALVPRLVYDTGPGLKAQSTGGA